MSTVYVVQEPLRWDHEAQALVKTFDVTPAEQYGDLVYLLGSSAAPWDLDSEDSTVKRELHETLQYVREDDYILLIGNPALIAAVIGVALQYLPSKRFRLLQWHGKDRKYLPINVNVEKEHDDDGQ